MDKNDIKSRKKILVVDDEADTVAFTKKRLEKFGYEVVTACDGEEGIKQVTEGKPDLILLDIMMPRMNGLTMLRHLKNEEATRCIPIILLTGRGETSSVFEAQKYGGMEYFVKPCDWEALVKCIRKYF
jgi:adenylate cyclase